MNRHDVVDALLLAALLWQVKWLGLLSEAIGRMAGATEWVGREVVKMTNEVDQVVAGVGELEDVGESALALITNLENQIQTLSGELLNNEDSKKLMALAGEVADRKAKWVAAIVANTPAAPAPAAPADAVPETPQGG